ncbi:MAG TPA: DUF4114 domain-containing protein [Bryobacteraceae bacterium]|nr:DUF4114 domain-containing protein [Bryobacteraceae bacterium]
MRIRPFHLAAALLAATCCVPAIGDTIMGAGSLQSWNASVLGSPGNPTYGGPYWNNQSGDGGNIGWCLTGSPACPIANPPGAISYFGNGTSAVDNMFFGNSAGSVAVSLLGNFTSQTGGPGGINYFGWYAIRPDGTLGSMATLWSSAAAVNTSAVFSPGSNYGFFIENVKGLGTPFEADYFWFMNSAFDSTGGTAVDPANHQHFAVFSPADNRFVLGMEDATPGDLDYNDMIVQVTTGVPEPASAIFVLCGLLAAARHLPVNRRRSPIA